MSDAPRSFSIEAPWQKAAVAVGTALILGATAWLAGMSAAPPKPTMFELDFDPRQIHGPDYASDTKPTPEFE